MLQFTYGCTLCRSPKYLVQVAEVPCAGRRSTLRGSPKYLAQVAEVPCAGHSWRRRTKGIASPLREASCAQNGVGRQRCHCGWRTVTSASASGLGYTAAFLAGEAGVARPIVDAGLSVGVILFAAAVGTAFSDGGIRHRCVEGGLRRGLAHGEEQCANHHSNVHSPDYTSIGSGPVQ